MNQPAPRVLAVGHCHADTASIRHVLEREFGADVDSAESESDAIRQLRSAPYDLVAVNRIFEFGGDGLQFVRTMQADEELRHVPVVLVSNYEWAQEEAVKLGALPGFGKSELGSRSMIERLRRALDDRTEAR